MQLEECKVERYLHWKTRAEVISLVNLYPTNVHNLFKNLLPSVKPVLTSDLWLPGSAQYAAAAGWVCEDPNVSSQEIFDVAGIYTSNIWDAVLVVDG